MSMGGFSVWIQEKLKEKSIIMIFLLYAHGEHNEVIPYADQESVIRETFLSISIRRIWKLMA